MTDKKTGSRAHPPKGAAARGGVRGPTLSAHVSKGRKAVELSSSFVSPLSLSLPHLFSFKPTRLNLSFLSLYIFSLLGNFEATTRVLQANLLRSSSFIFFESFASDSFVNFRGLMKAEWEMDQESANDSDPLIEKDKLLDSMGDVGSTSAGEIKDEEVDANSAACCRICLEYDSEPGDELISPCMCKGTQQFVHRSCLDHWRAVKEGFAFSHCTTCKAQFHLRVEPLEDNSWRKMKFRIFVARDVFLVFLAVQTAIAAIGAFAYFLDKDGSFRNSFSDGWDRILSKHPIPFYYCLGVLIFFMLLGFFGLILHCSSFNSSDPCMAGCRNCCYGWGILDCFPASMEACFALVVVFVVVFAILGIAYGFLAATMAIQRIWQRHYHILTKRELTKEYVVEDLRGCYTPPKLDQEHEERLRLLKLL